MISEKAFYAIVVAIVILGGVGIGVAYDHAITATPQTGSNPSGNQTNGNQTQGGHTQGATYYSLTLVITTNNQFNSTVGDQPAFYVLDNGTLESTANISLPAGEAIDLTIINYDDGGAPTASQYASVTGTTNDQMTIVNNTNVNSTYNGQNINVIGGQKVSQVPDNNIAHTFTILQGSTVVVNVPVTPSSIIQTSFTLSAGTYSWQCEAACGSGTSGWEGAMNTPGWMSGTVYVSSSAHAQASSVYSLDLVITTNNLFNQSVGYQPAFYVLVNGTLHSSSLLNLPSNKEIRLTIINFDDGGAPTASQYASVTGTANDKISIVNNTNVNSSQGGNGINIKGGSAVSQVPDSNIAHTFTILAAGNKVVVNVPAVPSSIITASFTLASGNYSWQCEAACGSGTSGWEGAMNTPGWMAGTVDVSEAPPAQTTAPVFYLSLMEIMDVSYNSTAGAQPIFYVVENGTLVSSANIYLPAHTKIVLTVTSYDMGNASVAPQFLKVQGTVGNALSVINGMVASGANTSQQWERQMTTFNASQVLHTFTILKGTTVLLNIPVVAGDTEMGTFYLNSTGTFTWQCEAACGTGSSGWEGAMSTPGWMEGTVYVS